MAVDNIKTMRETNILKILYVEENPVSAKVLAERLKVSERTIRTSIKALRADGYSISSSKAGYQLESKEDIPLRNVLSEATYIFSSPKERQIYETEKIIFSEQIDLYKLGEQLFISDATIEKDLIQIRCDLQAYHLKIDRSRDFVSIKGTENNKRKYISDRLNENAYASHQILEDLCGKIGSDSRRIYEILVKKLTDYHLSYNDYTIKNILVHLIINLYRAKEGYSYDNYSARTSIDKKTAEYQCARDILESLSAIVNLPVEPLEVDQLAFVIATKTTSASSAVQHKKLKNYVRDDVLQFTEKAIQKVNQTYFIDLEDDDFVYFFSLHLVNVLFRCENNVYNTNPLREEIYINNPVIYEVAVYIAQMFYQDFGYHLNTDEIAFISLHVGAVIENKSKNSRDSVNALLITGDYYSYISRESVISKITRNSDENLNILVQSESSNTQSGSIDLLIDARMAEDNRLSYTLPYVKISPLVTAADIAAINKTVKNIYIQKSKEKLRSHFLQFFDRKYFSYNHYEKTALDMISFMSNRLISDSIAAPEFKDAVITREKVTPTSFDNLVAIPHAIDSFTTRNICSVVINKHPMTWGLFKVQIIFLIGISYSRRKEFKEIYKDILICIGNPQTVEKLCSTKDFDEFINVLVNASEQKAF